MANTAAAGAAVGLGYGAAQPPLSAVVSYGAQLARRLVQVQVRGGGRAEGDKRRRGSLCKGCCGA